MVEREAEVVHHSVGVPALVGRDLNADSEAVQAQVEVGALCTLDAHSRADVAGAVVAVKQGPAGKRRVKQTSESVQRWGQSCAGVVRKAFQRVGPAGLCRHVGENVADTRGQGPARVGLQAGGLATKAGVSMGTAVMQDQACTRGSKCAAQFCRCGRLGAG